MFNHDQQFFAPLDRQEQEAERIDSALQEFYDKNPITYLWNLRSALPSYKYSIQDIVDMITDLGTKETIETLEQDYIDQLNYA